MAKILGKEEALFVMTGTMGNLLCILRFIFDDNGFPESMNEMGSDFGNFWLKIFIPACVDVERRLFVVT